MHSYLLYIHTLLLYMHTSRSSPNLRSLIGESACELCITNERTWCTSVDSQLLSWPITRTQIWQMYLPPAFVICRITTRVELTCVWHFTREFTRPIQVQPALCVWISIYGIISLRKPGFFTQICYETLV